MVTTFPLCILLSCCGTMPCYCTNVFVPHLLTVRVTFNLTCTIVVKVTLLIGEMCPSMLSWDRYKDQFLARLITNTMVDGDFRVPRYGIARFDSS
jgi:hypothetical protein